MKLSLTDTRVRIAAGLILMFFICKWSVGEMHNVKDKAKVAAMTATMKTVCVGRFLIDVPAEAQVFYRGAFLQGWDIAVYPDETEEQFANSLDSKEAELAAKNNEKDLPSLELARPINSNGVHGKLFIFDRNWVYGIEDGQRKDHTFAATLAYARKENTSVKFSAEFGDTRIDALAKIVTQFQPLAEDEIPTAPGFCFGRFMLLDPLTAEQNERVTMFFSLKDHPDFVFALDSAAGLKPPDSLLVRDARVRAEFESTSKTYRRGPRTIGGLRGEELVEGFNEHNGTTGYSFEWESFPDQHDVFRPDLDLELTTGHPPRAGGKPVQSSLSDEALLILWDKIASSIRVRPTSGAPAGDGTTISR